MTATTRPGPARRALPIAAAALALTAAGLARGGEPTPTAAAPAAPVPSSESAARMTLPPGFHATLFAAEPDVRQPIAMTTDRKGRLWVAENYTYPNWLQKATRKDRILIFEDCDGDGRFDSRKVFWDQGQTVSGLAVGFGGVWVCATPDLLFIPDADGDDVPDGPPSVVLDGWDVDAQHNLFNALTWAPDGWLWGCNGIMSNSKVGRPGTPEEKRVPINAGVWRVHPTTHAFEALAHGTTNPWGLDFDDHGQAFVTNCVIPHLFHVVPGAHFQRMYGQDFNPHAYALLESVADHLHWAGGAWQDSRGGEGKHGEAGGGHAHTGAMFYLGDNWPDQLRDTVFMNNIHGHRVNHDTLEARGSTYVARHAPDFLFANDLWFRGMELRYGPDGGVYLSDWSDTGECHENDADGAHRENGRIYKITYGAPKPAATPIDLGRLDDAALVDLQWHKNEWYVRLARLVMQERAAAGKDLTAARATLRTRLAAAPDVPKRLRALWALHATGGVGEPALLALLKDPVDHLRGWAVRFLAEDEGPSAAALDRFAALARDDPSPRVRLALASALQRVPVEGRRTAVEALAGHAEDAEDPYLPLMVWYAAEPLAAADPSRFAALASRAKIDVLRQFVARRVVQVEPAGPAAIMGVLSGATDPAVQADVLTGITEALQGRRGVPAPAGWASAFGRLAASPLAAVRKPATRLGLIYGDPRAAEALRATAADPAAPAADRREAIAALVEARVAGLAGTLQSLLADAAVRGDALRGLGAFDDPATPGLILARYAVFNEAHRADAVAALASRPAFARALLQAVGRGTVPARDLSAAAARQILALNDPDASAALREHWGEVRATTADKAERVAKYQALLTPDRLRGADRSQGREVFRRNCASCHKLFDDGGAIGPELTGSDRANPSYVLENVMDPSAAVGRDYQLTVVATRDGRTLAGMVREQTPAVLVLQTANERLSLDRNDVEEMRPSPASMMPEGLFDRLSEAEVRDLVSYLAAPAQVPVPTAGKP